MEHKTTNLYFLTCLLSYLKTPALKIEINKIATLATGCNKNKQIDKIIISTTLEPPLKPFLTFQLLFFPP